MDIQDTEEKKVWEILFVLWKLWKLPSVYNFRECLGSIFTKVYILYSYEGIDKLVYSVLEPWI